MPDVGKPPAIAKVPQVGIIPRLMYITSVHHTPNHAMLATASRTRVNSSTAFVSAAATLPNESSPSAHSLISSTMNIASPSPTDEPSEYPTCLCPGSDHQRQPSDAPCLCSRLANAHQVAHQDCRNLPARPHRPRPLAPFLLFHDTLPLLDRHNSTAHPKHTSPTPTTTPNTMTHSITPSSGLDGPGSTRHRNRPRPVTS